MKAPDKSAQIDEMYPMCACCQATSIRDGGTNVKTPKYYSGRKYQKWNISSGTQLQSNHSLPGKLCDYIVLRIRNDDPAALAVELKSRVQHVNAILDQLQAGADLLSGVDQSMPFAAVLVHSRGVGTQELRILRQAKIRFGTLAVPVATLRSGGDLGEVNV